MPVHSYSKDGATRYTPNPADIAGHAPNSAGGPHADPAKASANLGCESDGELVRAASTLHADDDDFSQAGTLVRELMDDDQRDRLVESVSGALGGVERTEVLERAFEYWKNTDADTGKRIEPAVRD